MSPRKGHHEDQAPLAAAKREQRARVLADAFAKHPERFPNGLPTPSALPTEVWINPPAKRIEVVGGTVVDRFRGAATRRM